MYNIITGRGTVVTGRLEHGVIKKGDEAVIMGHGKQFKTTVTGMSGDKICKLICGNDTKTSHVLHKLT